MIRRALPALALACAAACVDAGRGAQIAPAASAFLEPRGAPSSPAVSTQADAFLVWSADSAAAETVWLDAGGRAVAQRPEVVIAAGGAMWTWRKGTGMAKGIECQCMQKHDFDPGAHCPAQAQVEVADVVDLVSGRRASLLAVPDSVEGMAPVEQRAEPLSSAGPFLFAVVRSYANACGAHGSEGVEKPVFDLSAEARETDLLGGDTAAVLAREGAAARRALEQAGDAWTPLQEFRLSAVEARWTPAGALEVGYRFSAGACYACTDGESSAYNTSTLVPAQSPPAKLAAWMQAPEAVRRWWREHPPREHAGWSAAPADGLARFRSP
ncbi:MAG TPA: hypothetical protein VF092_07295 [Longimicrobium sp.]